jgi:hypothetical protein
MFFLTPLSALTILLFPHKIFKLDIGVVWCFTKLISYYQINQGQLTLFTFLKHSKMSKSSIKAKKLKVTGVREALVVFRQACATISN